MNNSDWKKETINDILPEEFYNLIKKNKKHIEGTFPITVIDCLDLEETEHFILISRDKEKRKEGYYFYIRHLRTNALIGYLCIKSIDYRALKCELAYFVDEYYQGKGIASKLVAEALDFCFSKLNMNKIFIRASVINKGSQQIAIKQNFKQEGILRNDFINNDGIFEDVVYFGLLKSEYNHNER